MGASRKRDRSPPDRPAFDLEDAVAPDDKAADARGRCHSSAFEELRERAKCGDDRGQARSTRVGDPTTRRGGALAGRRGSCSESKGAKNRASRAMLAARRSAGDEEVGADGTPRGLAAAKIAAVSRVLPACHRMPIREGYCVRAIPRDRSTCRHRSRCACSPAALMDAR